MWVGLLVSYAHNLLIFASCYAQRTATIVKVYIERKNMQVELIRFPEKTATLLKFETLKWEYTFATDALIAIPDESPVVLVRERRECRTFRDITISVFAISGHIQFGT